MAEVSLRRSVVLKNATPGFSCRPRPLRISSPAGLSLPFPRLASSIRLPRRTLSVGFPSRSRRFQVRQASTGTATSEPDPKAAGEQNNETKIEEAKLKILGLVAGLDRGVAASQADTRKVLQAVEQLEKEARLRTFQYYSSSYSPSPPTSSTEENTSKEYGLESMQGLWRLVYSSGFAAGSLGGLRPGPPTGRLPILVGQVLQRIDLPSRQLDNIVELRLNVLPWPLPAVEVTASLGHSFDVLGTSTFRINFEKTTVRVGSYDDPSSTFPALSTPDLPEFLRNPARSGQFETTYLDTDFRVSRGDLGELRVFVKA